MLNQVETYITAHEILAMAHPDAEISAKQLKMLERLVDDFPWFSYGQLLLLKGMKQQRHPSFNAQLLSASLYATSRERLHDYLKQIKAAELQKQGVHAADASLNDNGFGVAPVDAVDEKDAHAADAGLGDDGFEVLPFDTVCEKVVEIQPLTLAAGQRSSATYHEQLIDIFLAAQPSTIKPRSNVSDSDLAQTSEKDAAHELVSETLAEIYLAQGLPDKAEQIYLKLSLLYPEKKAYFAARFQSQYAKALA
ncbi:MAG: hypothetical protein LBB79_04580 [Prevotellaceae bacterium]|jgi:hypothetical protein|nr:hypothetical protein [Prevotellaceae bacterium]